MTRKHIRPMVWQCLFAIALLISPNRSLWATEKEPATAPNVSMVEQSTDHTTIPGKTIFKWHLQVIGSIDDPKKIMILLPGNNNLVVPRYSSFNPFDSWTNNQSLPWYSLNHSGSNYRYENNSNNDRSTTARDGGDEDDEDGDGGHCGGGSGSGSGSGSSGCYYTKLDDIVDDFGETGKKDLYIAIVLNGTYVYYNAPAAVNAFRLYYEDDDDDEMLGLPTRVPVPVEGTTVEAAFCDSKDLSAYNAGLTNPVWYNNSGDVMASTTVTASGTYWLVYGNCPIKKAKVYNITINVTPSVLTSAGAVRCGEGTLTLTAGSSDPGVIHWYDAATAGTELATGNSYTTPSISATTSYYVEAINEGCTNGTRTEVIATIKTIPTITGVTGAERCGTGTVTLLANASAGTISWYTAVEGGDLVGTGNSFTTPSLTSTTTYYVEVTYDGCTSTSRTAVTATIKTCVYYTYTQNYYGDDDDACIEGIRYAKAINLMSASIPGLGIVVGNQPANKSFKVMPSDVIKLNKLFKFEGSNRALRGNYTVNTSRNNLNNGLLGEAMALALNLRIPIQGARLASFSLDGAGGKCIVTQSIPNSCGNSGGHDDDDDDEDDDDDHDRSSSSSNNLRYYSLPASVINALPVKTVQGLYDYASSILGGANTTISLTELEKTLYAVNKAFYKGRLFVKFDATCGSDDDDDDDDEDCNRSVNGRSAIADEQATTPATVALGISAYPNPYRDRVTFRIALAQTAKASLMLYDMNGQLVARLFDGELPAMTTKFIEYTIPVSKRRNLVYVLRSGNTVQTGQLIR